MLSGLMQTMRRAAKAGGDVLMEHYGKVPREAVRKKSQTDFLSFVDEQSEKAIIKVLNEAYPDYAILAEEGGADNGCSAYRWIIDPLDGTRNYLSHLPVFAVSIALQKQDEIIAGLIYDPLHDEIFRAEKECGAFLNDDKISVSENTTLGESLIATGFPFKAKHKLEDYLKAFQGIFNESMGARRMGAAAIDLAYVACGRFDGFFELGLKPWDMAAGVLIIREAGGKVSDFWGQDRFMNTSFIIASNGRIHDAMESKIREAFPFFIALDEGV